jgi:AcrR family transcriptional regulator
VISDAAIDLIADSGLRALTHRGIDTALGLPAGSTSYYFRTKADLLAAVIDRVIDTSRSAFDEFVVDGGAADVTVRYLDHLIAERSSQLRARHALMIDPGLDPDVRARLAGSVFSVERATELFGDRVVAEGYVALCEGLVVVSLMGGRAELRPSIVTFLHGAGRT